MSSPGSPATATDGPVPATLGGRPGALSSTVASTFLAIPAAPTRFHKASDSDGDRGRGSQSGWARRTSSTWMKYSTVFMAWSNGRSSVGRPVAHRVDQLGPRHPVSGRPADPVGVVGQWAPDQPRAAVRSTLPHHQVGRQILRGPAVAEGGRLGAQPVEEVAERLSLLLGVGGGGHARDYDGWVATRCRNGTRWSKKTLWG